MSKKFLLKDESRNFPTNPRIYYILANNPRKTTRKANGNTLNKMLQRVGEVE